MNFQVLNASLTPSTWKKLMAIVRRTGYRKISTNMNSAGAKKHTIIFLSFFNRITPFLCFGGMPRRKKGSSYLLKELPFASHNCTDQDRFVGKRFIWLCRLQVRQG